MIFVKNFNNNIALVADQHNTEWVVIGSGIGFGKKAGDLVDETKIERSFVAAKRDQSDFDSLKDISAQTLAITDEIVKMVEPQLKLKFSSYQYLVLADHLEFAMQRAQENLDLTSGTTRWSLKKLFPQEYQLAQKSIELLENITKIKLSDGEIVFLTYHFLNLRSDSSGLQDTIKITKLIEQVVEIVQYQYGMTLDDDSFNFNRFITHLRSFMIQHLQKTSNEESNLDPAFLKLMIAKYPKAYETALKIGTFLKNKTGWILQPDEKVYLTLHIWRVTNRQKNQ